MITRILFLSILFWGSGFNLPAQTPNNNIESAIPLELDSAVSSRTHGNSVQWACVDESLTGKCIEYHNDQWFTFEPAQHYELLYLNVYQQQCRDVKGVQAVVFTGQPCQPQTYQILNCSSLATQDNIFILLERLIAGQTYFINIDGYLEDYCQFTLEVSTSAKGINAEARELLSLEPRLTPDSVFINIRPYAELEKEFSQLTLYRRKAADKQRQKVAVYSLAYAYGSPTDYVTFADTLGRGPLGRGPVVYALVGTDIGGRSVIVGEQEVKPDRTLFCYSDSFIPFLLDYKNNTDLEIRVWNHRTGQLLKRRLYTHSKHQPEYRLRVEDFREQGVREIRIEIINSQTREIEELLFNL
jgi:hypothetical protein